MRATSVGAVAGTAISGAFHHWGPPKMPVGRPFWTATLGVGLMGAMGAGLLSATNDGLFSPKNRSNSMLESTALSAVAFGVPGIWIHGKTDFSGKPVPRALGTLGVAPTGAIVGPLIHELTAPNSADA